MAVDGVAGVAGVAVDGVAHMVRDRAEDVSRLIVATDAS